MGIWNAHTSLGNILGTIIPSFWANPTTNDPNPPWGLSFVVPSLIMAGVAMLVFTLLVVGELYAYVCVLYSGLWTCNCCYCVGECTCTYTYMDIK